MYVKITPRIESKNKIIEIPKCEKNISSLDAKIQYKFMNRQRKKMNEKNSRERQLQADVHRHRHIL